METVTYETLLFSTVLEIYQRAEKAGDAWLINVCEGAACGERDNIEKLLEVVNLKLPPVEGRSIDGN